MEYNYKAFISYRHQSFDKKIADRLQRMLERYKIPKGIGKRERWRVFRDETELPTSSDLSGDIKTALEESEFLIVICSRALKKSRWCMEEITYFKELHGGSVKNIITLLVEGSPEEVFPSELCHSAVETVGEDGSIIKKEIEVEPLAANISDVPPKKAFKKLKTEFLRIAAPLIGCGYDDLYNRDRKRKIKNISAAVAAAFVCVTAFGIYNTAMRMELAQINSELLITAASSAASNAETLFEKGDRIEAIKTALSVRPYADDENKLLPATKKVLADALYAYNTSTSAAADRILETDVPVKFYDFSSDGSAVYAYDSDNSIYAWSAETGELLFKTAMDHPISALYPLKDGDSFCVVTYKGIEAFSASKNKTIWSTDTDLSAGKTFISDDGSIIAWTSSSHVKYDEDINEYDLMFGEDKEKTLYGSWITVCFADTKTGDIIYEDTIEADASDDENISYHEQTGDFYGNSGFILSCENSERADADVEFGFYNEYDTKFLYFNIEDKACSQINYESGLKTEQLCYYNDQKFAVFGDYFDADADEYIYNIKSIDLSGEEIFSTIIDEDFLSLNEVLQYMEWENDGLKLLVLNDSLAFVLIDETTGEIYRSEKADGSTMKSICKKESSAGAAMYILYKEGAATYIIEDNTEIWGSLTFENEDSYAVNGLVYDGDECYAAVGEDTSSIILYKKPDIANYNTTLEESAAGFTLSPDEKFFFCGGSNDSGHEIHIYDTASKELLSTAPCYFDNCVFSGEYVVCKENNTAEWYSVYTGKSVKGVDLEDIEGEDFIKSAELTTSGDGKALFTAGSCFIYKLGDNTVKLVPDESTFKTYSYRGDSESKTVSKESNDQYPYLRNYIINDDGSRIAAETNDDDGYDLFLMDTATGESISLFEGREKSVLSDSSFAFSSNETAALYIDNSVIIYNTNDGSVINTIELGGITVRKMIFTPDSKNILLFSGSAVLYKYDAESGEAAGQLTSFKDKADADSSVYPQFYLNSEANEIIVNAEWNYTAFVDIDRMEISLVYENKIADFIESSQEIVISGLSFCPYYNSEQLIEMANKALGET